MEMKKLKLSAAIISLFIGLLFFLLVGNILSIRSQFLESEIYSREHIHTLDMINEVRSSLAHLSLWQLSYTTAVDDSEKFSAKRHMKKRSIQIADISDSISAIQMIDSMHLSRFLIAVDQLLMANDQVVIAQGISNDRIIIDSLNVDYRSVFDILTFHLDTIQELTIRKMNRRSKYQNTSLLTQIVMEIVIIVVIALIIIIMVTGRRKAERLLSETEGYFNDVVNSSPSALIGMENDGTIFQMNKEALRLCSSDHWETESIESCFSNFKCMTKLRDAIQNDKSFSDREIITHTDSRQVYTITTFPFTSSGRGGAVIRIDEVTEQDQLEEQLRQTQKMNAIGQLAGGISHDFNNTLAAIMGATELLHFNCKDSEQLSYIDMIIDATNQAAELTKKLLTFARKNHREKSPINIHSTISSTEVLIRHSVRKNISIDLDLAATNYSINGDPSELQSLLLNLGINADHAMPEGGSIVISTKDVSLSDGECHSLPFKPKAGNFIQIEFSDTGTGISPSHLKHVFEPFFTTKEHGTGIGLASVYGTIQQHNGSVKVTSGVGEGTSFLIYLPLIAEEKAVSKDISKKLVPGEGTILVADDEPVIRRTLTLMLKRMGYTIIIATNGVEAYEIFKKERENIDLIMLDMIMPVMDGLEALKEIRKIDTTIPIVISSGYAHSEDMDEAKKLHVSATLSKPYSGNVLSNCISSILKN